MSCYLKPAISFWGFSSFQSFSRDIFKIHFDFNELHETAGIRKISFFPELHIGIDTPS